MATHLIEGLRAEGEVDSVGRFTLDPVKAREKLQKFQLVDAHRYVLELVQAAVLRGATDIGFAIDADDMHMRFDGAVFSAEELGDVWGSIFADGDDRLLRGVRQLALGLNAALGLGPKRIVVRSGGQELRLVPGAADVHRAVEPALAGTTIHVAQRVKLAGLGLFFKNLVGSLAEEVHLRERCVYAAQAITLDGARISRGFKIAEALGVHEIAAPGVRGLVAVTRSEAAPELRLIKDGVWIDSRELAGCGPGVLALVEGEGLRKDVSLAKIVADETLAAVLSQVQAARWSAMARVLELSRSLDGRGRNWEKRVRAEALRFWTPADLTSGPDAKIVAEGLIWHEARAHNPEKIADAGRLTLLDLRAAIVPAADREPATLRFADRVYNQLAASGPAIPYVHEDERDPLMRMLGCTLVPADELERMARREKARKAFLQRRSTGRLPDRPYAVREAFVGEGMRGEVGVLLSEDRPAQETTWLCREGCLLTAFKLDWGIPGVEVEVEAGFEPNDDHDDAVRNEVVVDAALYVLAALQGPLERLARSQDITIAATARGIIKAWLLLVVDEEARSGLWQRLKVAKKLWPNERAVRAMLPGPQKLLDAEVLQRTPLFEDFDGARRSLDDLEWRLKKQGKLDELDRSVAHEPGQGSEVLWLGRGDRAILAALFGAKALQSWQPVLLARQKERAFWARPPELIGAAARRLRGALPSVAGDPSLWCRTFDDDGVRGVVVLARNKTVPTSSDGLREAAVDLYIGDRRVGTRRLDVGLGPISAAAYCGELRATSEWDDVAADEALTRVAGAVGRAAWALLAEVLRTVPDEDRWVAQLAVRRLMLADRDEVTERAPALTQAPLIGTITGERVSLETIEAVIRKYGKIGWVLASTKDAAISDPPVLRDKRGLIDALRDLVGPDGLVEGDVRVHQREIGTRLESLPPVAAARLDPGIVWRAVKLDSGSPKLDGEIGLSRRRTSGGLNLTLCTLGRRVTVIEDTSFEAACEAIVADPSLPLKAGATVDTRDKRYGQYLKRCRRAIHGLVVGLCERYAGLAEPERAQARALLLRYVGAERKFGEARREARQAAWSAVCRLPLLVDVWGREHTLAGVEARVKGGAPLEGVFTAVKPPPGTEGVDRPILRIDAASEASLAGLVRLTALDHRWAEVSAALLELASAPEFVMPDVRAGSWIDRNATLAGGLQAHLWIPREPAATDALVFTRGNKVVGRLVVFDGVSCAGVIRGDGLVVDASGVTLDDRQRVSLAKQVCMLIDSLARQLKTSGGRVKGDERERARSWLVAVAAVLERTDPELQKGLGKPFTQMCEALAAFASPSMRNVRVSKPVAELKPVEAPRVEVKEVRASVTPPRAEVRTPEQALLTAVRAELAWARERHGSLLERLRLDRLAIGSGKPGVVAFVDAIELQRGHPLIARQLARLGRGEGIDSVDLMFVVSAVYTLMNAVSEEIGASDEQAFVARMAEGLALALA